MVLVGEQRERQAELLRESALRLCALGADAPDVRAALDDRLVGVAELARLDRAAGRVVLGIEVEDGPPSALVGEAMDRARRIGQGDVRCDVADRRHVHRQSVAGDSTTSREPALTVTPASASVRRFERPRAAPTGSGSSTSGYSRPRVVTPSTPGPTGSSETRSPMRPGSGRSTACPTASGAWTNVSLERPSRITAPRSASSGIARRPT